jgi:hypothetical protein
MKKNWFYLFLLMAFALMPLTSCGNDDEPKAEEEEEQHDPMSDDDQAPDATFDALKWLQRSILVEDENGEVFRRVCGKPLDESQPDVISVPVADYAAAEKLFLDWVAPGKEATKVEGGYDYYLTDGEGKKQGSVSFRAAGGEGGEMARMTVAPGTNLKHISMVKFIDAELWPENDTPPMYAAGMIYEIEGAEIIWDLGWDHGLFYYDFEINMKPLPFCCLQGNTDGKEAILVWISPDANDINRHPKARFYEKMGIIKHLPSQKDAEKVLEFHDNNPFFWDNMLAVMDDKGYEWSAQPWEDSARCYEFMLDADGITAWFGPFTQEVRGILDLDSAKGQTSYVSKMSGNMYRYMLIKIVPPIK